METHAAPPSETQHQAVCYKCSYVGLEGAASHKCPLCGFLLITASRDVLPQKSVTVRDVLDRSSVEKVGAPQLPGVGPNEDELVTTVQLVRRSAVAISATPRFGTGTTALNARSGIKVSLALAGALVAGLVTAMLVHGGM